MPIMPDATLLASGVHDQAQGNARAYAACLGASGRGEMRGRGPLGALWRAWIYGFGDARE